MLFLGIVLLALVCGWSCRRWINRQRERREMLRRLAGKRREF